MFHRNFAEEQITQMTLTNLIKSSSCDPQDCIQNGLETYFFDFLLQPFLELNYLFGEIQNLLLAQGEVKNVQSAV